MLSSHSLKPFIKLIGGFKLDVGMNGYGLCILYSPPYIFFIKYYKKNCTNQSTCNPKSSQNIWTKEKLREWETTNPLQFSWFWSNSCELCFQNFPVFVQSLKVLLLASQNVLLQVTESSLWELHWKKRPLTELKMLGHLMDRPNLAS